MNPKHLFVLSAIKKIGETILLPELLKIIAKKYIKSLSENTVWCGCRQTILRYDDKYYFRNCFDFGRIAVKNISQFGVCGYNFIVLDENRCVWGSGENKFGELGLKKKNIDPRSPVKILPKVKSISVGYNHTLAIGDDACLYAWGDNSQSQLGVGHQNKCVSVQKVNLENVIFASCKNHSAVITADLDLYMWGENEYGQLGLGDKINRNTPYKVGSGYKFVACGGYYTIAIDLNGKLFGCGHNINRIFGRNENCLTNLTQITSDEFFVSVVCGISHVAAINNLGELFMWGMNNYGQLGLGTDILHYEYPQKVLSDIKMVSCGYDHTMAISTYDQIYVWGSNSNGQLLLQGSTYYKPVKINFG